MPFLMLILYALCTSLGMVMLKKGASAGLGFALEDGTVKLQFGAMIAVGIIFYIGSFILAITLMSKMNLSYFYPVSLGLVYVLICVASVVFLKEKIHIKQIAGMVLIFAGIVVMNLPGSNA